MRICRHDRLCPLPDVGIMMIGAYTVHIKYISARTAREACNYATAFYLHSFNESRILSLLGTIVAAQY